jgi:WD40 repeat protein
MLTPEKNIVAALLSRKGLFVWSQSKNAVVHRQEGVSSAELGAEGRLLATLDKRSTIEVWDLTRGQTISRMSHDDVVDTFFISPDGRYLATARTRPGEVEDSDKKVTLWEVASGRPVATLNHEDRITTVEFSRSGIWVATASWDHTARMWSVPDGREIYRVCHEDSVTDLAFSPAAEVLVTGSKDGTARIWSTKATKAEISIEEDSHVDQIAFSPSGQYIATVVKNAILSEGTVERIDIHLRDVNTGEDIYRFQHDNLIAKIRFSRNGKYLASASYDRTARLWNTSTGMEDLRIPHASLVLDVAVSPDEGLVATACRDGTVRVWDVTAKRELWMWEAPSAKNTTDPLKKGAISSVIFSPSGEYIATANPDGVLRIWKARSGDKVAALQQPSLISAISFSPRGEHLAVATEQTLKILKVSDFSEIAKFEFDRSIRSLLFSPCDNKLAVAGSYYYSISEDLERQARERWNGRVSIWDFAKNREIQRLSHEGAIQRVSFSKDGRYIATASADNTARIWEIGTGEIILGIAHRGNINDIAFDPDNKFIATADENGLVRLSLWKAENLIVETCAHLTRNLTQQEWSLFLGSEPYQKTCSKLGIHASVIEAARNTARKGDVKGAVAQFKKILEIEPNLALRPEQEARKMYAFFFLEEGKSLAKKGKIEEAIADYQKVTQIDPSLNIDFESWNSLCWHGALTGFAQDVMGACERAVALAPEDTKGLCRDSRGLVKALTGDYLGAIEDFEAYVDWAKNDSGYGERRRKRASWIKALQAGKNPFDQETLEALRGEE